MISVKFFASVRERLGLNAMDLEMRDNITIADVLAQVEAVSGTSLAGQHLLAARNQVHVSFSEPVLDGDEIAFFPPVTGG
ncbi:MoaD/ThiS family protein [Acidithiobacillus sp. AMEEHan]|uniref:MoaD/ThiS family protein n=1 Tax=Acidithiobacillus sp. AMEEHan TaxID=2994951 RepID=UPI0027E4414B|nr:MoaD/ThiS family protein [Acidithiobacillus sp. AMEEHan]